jgi:hypothetical protein
MNTMYLTIQQLHVLESLFASHGKKARFTGNYTMNIKEASQLIELLMEVR